jgi:hypothetical protein
VQVSGGFVAALELEGTIDGTNWFLIAALSAPGAIEVAQTIQSLRCNVTAYTSGSPVVTLGARNARSV